MEASAEEFFSSAALREAMPVAPPFLFLDEATIGPLGARGRYTITGEEFFLAGHFKGNPVMPASLMLEALGQLGVFYLLKGMPPDEAGRRVSPATLFFASCDGVRCHRVCRPGDVLELAIKPRRIRAPLAVMEGVIRVGGEKAVGAEEITLTFGYAAA